MSTRMLVVLLLAACVLGRGRAAVPAEPTHYPLLVHADLPTYPPLARYAHISGTVEIQITVEKGAVVDAQVKSNSSVNQLLPLRSVENLKTWQFQSEVM